MARYDQNCDQINSTGLPVYERSGVSGLQITPITDIDSEPCNITEAKLYGWIDSDTDDSLYELFLKAARIDIEQYLQKSLGIRTIKLTAIKLPKNYLLTWGPVNTISTAGFTNVGDILIEGGSNITVEYVSNASLVNDSIKTAIYRQAKHYYDNRNRYSEVAGNFIDEVKNTLSTFRHVVFP